ncbi:cilia- and flagella-associated protein 36 isoform X2 [Syngnathoides biaculeatus]|uniref:cilia- and flagella-associated protein 36 isoform X2 n=1 Tax=Syngnathoides biaculeatus TaxID=300417 RepID=UPI002ADE93F1|nr:cilia- and flagella-associated protein 36 isoform X2 [Syngnathoides biaculeatus]
MAEDDSEWVVESIVGYLGSPEWVIPVTDFMEHKCTVFDDEDENKLVYTEIHQQYKKLVEKLLENYMQEVGINEQQFLDACTSPFAKSKTVQSVFQPVLATDDFQMFRSLMVQKNMELQLQALRVIKERNGALPDCLTDGEDVMTELQQQEMKILQEVLKKSKEEYDEEMSWRLLLEEERACSTSGGKAQKGAPAAPAQDAAPAIARADDADAKSAAPPSNQVNGKTSQNPESKLAVTALAKHVEKSTSSSSSSSTRTPGGVGVGVGVAPKTLPPVRAPVGVEQTAAESWLEEAHREAGFSQPYTELSASQQERLQQRASYLREQRDKLHALKKERAAKQGPAPEEEAPRPPASPAAPPASVSPFQTRSLCRGDPRRKLFFFSQEISTEERKKLQKRKHLADKLKEEVIKK